MRLKGMRWLMKLRKVSQGKSRVGKKSVPYNVYGVTIPNELAEAAGLTLGDPVIVELSPKANSIVIRKFNG